MPKKHIVASVLLDRPTVSRCIYTSYLAKNFLIFLFNYAIGNGFFREGVTKCSDEVYNKVTGICQQNKHLFGLYRLHVSTC